VREAAEKPGRLGRDDERIVSIQLKPKNDKMAITITTRPTR
jgi:hypothetical protein